MSLDLLDFRIRQRDYLLRITRAIVSRLNLRAVLRMIIQASVDMLQGQLGLIALRDQEEREVFSFWASYGLPPVLVDSFLPLVEEVPDASSVEEFQIPHISEKLQEIAEETGLLLRQVVSLPMVVDGTLVGVIFIFRSHSHRFSSDDRQILASFADYAAIAVNNARLYESVDTERRRLDALLDASADGIMVMGPDLTLERFNRALTMLTGWPAEAATGQQHHEIITWARRRSSEVKSPSRLQDLTLEQAVSQGWPRREGQSLYIEGDLLRRNGSTVSVGITYAPLTTRNGHLLNIIGIVRDITHFQEANQLKDTFISVVSHELKTPVAIIKGYAETMSRPEAWGQPEMMRELSSAIIEEADRLARLVDDLLDVSQLQASGLSFRQVEDVALSDIARQVVERYQPQASEHTLRLDFPPNFPTIEGDPQRLEQVIDNLVSNAIKYSPRGGEIIIQGEASLAEVKISVSDEGVGIPLEEQERIFEHFYRVEGPETRAVSGAGLGLYLTRAIVRAHGGRCWVRSTPGQGATFHVALPRETQIALWDGREQIIDLPLQDS